MDRMPETSTCLMRLPTTSFSRSLFSVSTSGSSGTGAHLGVLSLGLGAVARCRQRPPRLLHSRLLGLLLRPTLARPALLLVDVHGGEEALGVVRTALLDLITGQRVEPLRREFLQTRLVVLAARTGGRFGDAVGEESEHQFACRLPPAVEVHGADDRLHRVGEDRGLVAAA